MPDCFGVRREQQSLGCLGYGCPWHDDCFSVTPCVHVEWETDRNFDGYYRVYVEGYHAILEERPPWDPKHERTYEELEL